MAWGKLENVSGNLASTIGTDNPLRNRGYHYDSETSLYYLNQSYYNPEWGRLINADDYMGQTGGLLSHNLFAYCANNPVINQDPSGRFWWVIGEVAIGAYEALVALGLVCAGAGIAGAISEIVDNVSENTSEKKDPPTFPENPADFNPVGLRYNFRPGKCNGCFWQWFEDGRSKKPLFQWDENPNYSNGPHYHIRGVMDPDV